MYMLIMSFLSYWMYQGLETIFRRGAEKINLIEYVGADYYEYIICGTAGFIVLTMWSKIFTKYYGGEGK